MLSFVMKFLIPFAACVACLYFPVERVFPLDDYMCVDEAKQVMMAASVTAVMLVQAQTKKSAPLGTFGRDLGAPFAQCN